MPSVKLFEFASWSVQIFTDDKSSLLAIRKDWNEPWIHVIKRPEQIEQADAIKMVTEFLKSKHYS